MLECLDQATCCLFLLWVPMRLFSGGALGLINHLNGADGEIMMFDLQKASRSLQLARSSHRLGTLGDELNT